MESSTQCNLVFGTHLIFVAVIRRVPNCFVKFESQLLAWYNDIGNFKLKMVAFLDLYTVKSLYKTPHYNTYLDITWSCCGSQNFLLLKFTKKL